MYMKCKWILLTLLGLAVCLTAAPGEALAGKYKEASKRNEADCKKWCDENKPECEFCSTKSGCGKGYDRLKKWGGRGKNWHACGKRKSRDELWKERYDACLKWCSDNKDKCDKCDSFAGCGKGYKQVKAWTGRGHNRYACKRTKYGQASKKNEQNCNKWCDENDDCFMCRDQPCGGVVFKTLKKWKGRGRNWYACKEVETERDRLVIERIRACDKWCWENKDKCDKCSGRVGCGKGYKKIKTWRGKGSNWYACKKR